MVGFSCLYSDSASAIVWQYMIPGKSLKFFDYRKSVIYYDAFYLFIDRFIEYLKFGLW